MSHKFAFASIFPSSRRLKRDRLIISVIYSTDLRDPSTTPLNFTKSINLALSERGLSGLRGSGNSELAKSIVDETIPMYGRMIHGRNITGDIYEQSQAYDINGKVSIVHIWRCLLTHL